MGAYIEASDYMGTGLDMSGFTNGVVELDMKGESLEPFEVPPSDYDRWDLDGSGPFIAETWMTGSRFNPGTGFIWRDAGQDIFLATLVYLDADFDVTAVFLNLDVVIDDRLLDGDPVKVNLLKGDDVIVGNNYDDILKGGAGKDLLIGNDGNDKLYGEKGGDFLAGMEGKDNLFGGSGRDVFVFDSPFTGADRISDFSVADDTIYLDNAAFTSLSDGKLNKAAFVANTTGQAADSSDRIIYETDNGRLFYDQDGKGGAGRVYIATLSPDLKLTNADFLVV
jgi:Ca2+-binding RTX toxin-like protein